MPNTKVNLFIVGAPKSGTTTLFEHFSLHPEIDVLSVKEPHYFGEYSATNGTPYTTLESYQTLFPQTIHPGVKYLADFSTSYLYSTSAAKEIENYNPDAKIIALLRNPVERTISMYFHQRKSAVEPLDFASALNAESRRIAAGWGYGFHYRAASLYHEQVERYTNIFGAQFRVYLFEDLVRQPYAVLEQMQHFLGLAAPFSERAIHRNKTGEPKSIFLQKLIASDFPGKPLIRRLLGQKIIDRIIDSNVGEKPRIDPDIKAELTQYFAADIHKLESLLGRKTGWI